MLNLKFSERMSHFDTGIFTVLSQMKREKISEGMKVVDLSVGTPNIPPAQHIIDALVESARDKTNYIYALNDTAELQNAVSEWYRRRYGVEIDGETEVTSLLGSQDGLSHIALAVVDPGDLVLV
ncbi:MAG TPA: aminotransferase class I/II-fold pyridoxal phosphate-dependent enzyme, partial [Caproiciproducens sp.]|nr:aminotransferase class I/II-fold pyridoxal phosphate-dependent enzyme [Caproiciproducens sp.]